LQYEHVLKKQMIVEVQFSEMKRAT